VAQLVEALRYKYTGTRCWWRSWLRHCATNTHGGTLLVAQLVEALRYKYTGARCWWRSWLRHCATNTPGHAAGGAVG